MEGSTWQKSATGAFDVKKFKGSWCVLTVSGVKRKFESTTENNLEHPPKETRRRDHSNTDSMVNLSSINANADNRTKQINAECVANFKVSGSVDTVEQSSKDDDGTAVCPPPTRDGLPSKNILNWREFLSKNYSKQPLFKNFKPSYKVKSMSNFKKYLPSQNDDLEKNCTFQHFGRNSTQYDTEGFYFVGAPIKKLVWVPLPANVSEQYVLLSYHTELQHVTNDILLLLKIITPVAPQDKSTPSPINISLQYAINIPDGTVHCMSFLPSGGYDFEANRLGLVALGTTSCSAKIYALPIDIAEKKSRAGTNEKHALIEPKCAMILNFPPLDGIKYYQANETQCLDLCWSEASQHLHIFAADSNGRISYWDLKEMANFRRSVVDEAPHSYSVHTIYTNNGRAKCLALHYCASGVRWLAVKSGRRHILIIDMENFTSPRLFKYLHCKGVITSVDWPLTSKELMYDYEDCTRAGCSVLKLHHNPDLDVTACATACGCLKYQQRCSQLQLVTSWKCLQQPADEQCMDKNSIGSDRMGQYVPNDKVCALRWNLSERQEHLLAIGYESGYMRLLKVEWKEWTKRFGC